MSEVHWHYETLLAPHYSWSYGGHDAKVSENREFFKTNSISPLDTKIALDLGAGSGFQTIPLLELGFHVMAVDFSGTLLAELKANCASGELETLEADILDFSKYSGKNPELIICMGDTIAHLPEEKSVEELIANAFSQLRKNGKIILSFRDLKRELKDAERFIPVRSEEDRIFTCFLDYRKDRVFVHDIVHRRGPDGWKQEISVYRKLRLDEATVRSLLEKAGFSIESSSVKHGMISMIGRKS